MIGDKQESESLFRREARGCDIEGAVNDVAKRKQLIVTRRLRFASTTGEDHRVSNVVRKYLAVCSQDENVAFKRNVLPRKQLTMTPKLFRE